MIKPVIRPGLMVLGLLLVAACAPRVDLPTPTGQPPSQASPTAAATAIPEVSSPLPTAAPDSTPFTPPTEAPTATNTPSSAPAQPLTTPTTLPRSIILEEPRPGALVSSPVQVRGWVSVTPFEATLVVRVYDARGQVVGEGPITMATEMGQPGEFDGSIAFQAGSGGPGRIEVAEISAADGSVVISAEVEVVLVPTTVPGLIEIPAAGARVTLPIHILARVGQPGEQVVVTLRWQDGTELVQSFPVLRGEDGKGLLVTSLNWMNEGPPPQPATQPATLEVRSPSGDLLAQQGLTVLSLDDPDTQPVAVCFLLGETLQPVQRRIPKTARIGTAALEELLWGPPPPNLAGFGTAIPLPEEVLNYPGRGPDWGPRVQLRKLTIVDGVATADFSREMRAYGGGSLRVLLIRQQIEQTLKQFPTVQTVVIAIEGETEGVLEP